MGKTLDQRRAIKFTYSPLGNHLEKPEKMIEDQEGKLIKAIEENRKQLVESNAHVKKGL